MSLTSPDQSLDVSFLCRLGRRIVPESCPVQPQHVGVPDSLANDGPGRAVFAERVAGFCRGRMPHLDVRQPLGQQKQCLDGGGCLGPRVGKKDVQQQSLRMFPAVTMQHGVLWLVSRGYSQHDREEEEVRVTDALYTGSSEDMSRCDGAVWVVLLLEPRHR